MTNSIGRPRIVAGFGFRQACTAPEMLAVLQRASTLCHLRPDAIACPAGKANQAIRDTAAAWRLPLIQLSAPSLAAAQPACRTHSVRAWALFGVGSVAEACALAAAGPASRLRLRRITGAGASCAIAASAS